MKITQDFSKIKNDYQCDIQVKPKVILTPEQQEILMEMMQQTWIFFVRRILIGNKK